MVTGAEARDAWQAFLRAYKVVKEKLDDALRASLPLTIAELDVLWVVHEVGGGRLRYIDLAKKVQLSQSRVSRQVVTLEEKGYLTREATASDRRATYAVITDLGRHILAEADEPLWRAWHEHFLHHIRPEELGTFTRIMEDLVAAKGHWSYSAEDNPFTLPAKKPRSAAARKKPGKTEQA